MVGGCMPCQHCQGSGLVGGMISGLKAHRPDLGWQQRDAYERELIAEALTDPAYSGLKTKKMKADFVKAFKYAKAGVPVPAKRPSRPRTPAQQSATQRMRDARASAYELANEWGDKVKTNPKCDKIDIRKLLKPGEMAKLRQRLDTYDL